MNNLNLETVCRQLRLSGLHRTLGTRLQEAAASRLTHAEFLELIFQDELNVRKERLLLRRTKTADFRHLKTLEDFDWRFNPNIPRKPIYELATGQFIRQAKDLHAEVLQMDAKEVIMRREMWRNINVIHVRVPLDFYRVLSATPRTRS